MALSTILAKSSSLPQVSSYHPGGHQLPSSRGGGARGSSGVNLVRNVFVFPKSAGTNSPYDGYSPSPRLSGRFNRKLSSTEAGADRDYQIDRQESSEFHQRDFSSETEVPKDDLSRDYQWNFSSTETETERVGDDYQIKIKNPGRNIPIRIKTPRIRNPADGIKIRNPGKNINVRIRTPIFKNPASGVKINIGRFNRKLSSTEAVGVGRDYQINSRFHQRELSSEREVPKNDLSQDYDLTSEPEPATNYLDRDYQQDLPEKNLGLTSYPCQLEALTQATNNLEGFPNQGGQLRFVEHQESALPIQVRKRD